jgi:hypothetical protein
MLVRRGVEKPVSTPPWTGFGCERYRERSQIVYPFFLRSQIEFCDCSLPAGFLVLKWKRWNEVDFVDSH